MEDKMRYIIRDLLPLYREGLLSEETEEWFEEQVKNNPEYKKLVTETPPQKKSIDRRLSLYQILFTAISFFLALKMSLLNGSFGFILWYAVLGLLIYLFYRNVRIVFLFSFVPIFIWGITDSLAELAGGDAIEGATLGEYVISSIYGAVWLAAIHCLFAVVGSFIGWLCIKLTESRSCHEKENRI
ncbi:hypothetical protein [Bacillus glycinifermentans]|uniref:hypothetical protein n=1 Tax=Bacillus glycinifermentans TaxID=1664069 RepID=UPI001FF222D3|nr:hypothetical protein [Bacillus glycinifermentans]MEC3609553.1 hypothetical protein [Bacillus glycinifermentans]UOY88217.1 hypothetical protein MW696_19685 [Bacillus glycinifermentans]